MPTVIVNRREFFKKLGKEFSNKLFNYLADDEFTDVCFAFGIELDDITTESEIAAKEAGKEIAGLSKEVVYKIEVAANRYDLLCLEGLCLSLRVFLGFSGFPKISITNQNNIITKATAHPSVKGVRPYLLCAILRNISFTEETLKGFIELQDKLHNNICRKRSLVSMGTHDLDTVKGPFTYLAKKPNDFKFRALNRSEENTGAELLQIYKSDNKLKFYVPLLEGKELFPILCDSQGIIMAMPPIINSEHTRLTVNTKNVFIDITGTDVTKSHVVLNTLIAMFSEYCKEPYTVEAVEIQTADNETIITPNINNRTFKTNVDYLNNLASTPNLNSKEVANYLEKMSLSCEVVSDKDLVVHAPITRSDVLHPCDIAEDLAISYGYNSIKKQPAKTLCHGSQQPINKLTDLIRLEFAQAEYVECLTMALISKADNFDNMNKKETECVHIQESKVHEFQIFRTSLLPCLLKTIEANKTVQVPFKVFEISDVVLIDPNTETGAKNRRRLAFAYTGLTSGFEIVQGMVDHLLGNKFNLKVNDKEKGYYISPSNDSSFFPDRQAHIFVKGHQVGIFGISHPKVLFSFKIKNPVSIAEIDIEAIFDMVLKGEVLQSNK